MQTTETHARCGRTATPLNAIVPALVATIAADQLSPLSDWSPSPWHLLGAPSPAAGLALAIGADAQFKRAGTAVSPFARASVLVTGGVFAFSRNPMYLGMVLALLGAALLLGSIPVLLVAPLYAAFVQAP